MWDSETGTGSNQRIYRERNGAILQVYLAAHTLSPAVWGSLPKYDQKIISNRVSQGTQWNPKRLDCLYFAQKKIGLTLEMKLGL